MTLDPVIYIIRISDRFLTLPTMMISALLLTLLLNLSPPSLSWSVSRRRMLETGAASLIVTSNTPAVALAADTGVFDDLPPEAQRSYSQYKIPLQTSADFYVFELQNLLKDPNEWGLVGDLFTVNNSRGGQGSPNRIEREFTNTMRILLLSMPPDTADEMRDAQFRFEAAMSKISKATSGIRRDLPIELDKNLITVATAGWEEGRVALNDFFTATNNVTGLDEMKTIPPPGADQFKQYGRSERKYVDLKKKIKLCQNRGGPTLSAAWGQLMVSGYLQDSCGIPDLDAYFYQ